MKIETNLMFPDLDLKAFEMTWWEKLICRFQATKYIFDATHEGATLIGYKKFGQRHFIVEQRFVSVAHEFPEPERLSGKQLRNIFHQ